MGGCCGKQATKETDQANTEFGKGGDRDVSGGPLKNRGCTDIFCLIIFILHWFGYVAVTFYGVKDGEPAKLYKPRDFKGDYCGLEAGGLNNHTKLLRTLNVTATVDEIAKQLVCSQSAQVALKAIWGARNANYQNYECACCLRPCGACSESLGLKEPGAGTTASRMGEFTNPSQASSLFSSGSSNAMSFSADSILNEVTKYFNAVCMSKSCILPKMESARRYTYSPSPDASWKTAWDTLAIDSSGSVPSSMQTTITGSFTFDAYPTWVCPYHARYCIPFPGVTFKEAEMDYCMPKLDDSALAAVGDAMAAALNSNAVRSLANSVESSFGSAVGDIMATMDAFCVMAFFTFVIGLCFMVLLRFLVGIVVWGSLFIVFVGLGIGGFAVYLRSIQCKGMGIFDTAVETSVALATTAQHAVHSTVTGNVFDETLTGDGKDYRGAQIRTRTGRLCQEWSAQTPHLTNPYLPGVYPYNESDLTLNYCRNPQGDANTIWCFTTDTEKKWQECRPVGAILPECANGYVITDQLGRDVLFGVAIAIWSLAGIWVIAVCCLRNRIALAVAVNKVAAQFVYNNPTILGVPVSQMLITVMWVLLWTVGASFLLSQVPSDYTPTDSYATYAEAYGTADVPGACTGQWPAGIVWKYQGDPAAANDTCSGVYGVTIGMTPKCWRCSPPRYIFDGRFAAAFFSLLWNNAFIVAVGQLTVAGACAGWFFTKDENRGKDPVIRPALYNCFRYHLGSLAFGSFILAVIQFIRYMMMYFEKQAAAQKNRVMVIVLKVVQCCLWCFEKCIKFLNKNAYIQIALLGTPFCTSAKNAFFLIMRNALRFGVVALLGGIIRTIGIMFILTATMGLGYIILQSFHPDVSPVVPMICYFILGYMAALLFMNVFGLAVDTCLQCFIACEEMKITEEFVPGPLKSLVDANPSKKKGWFRKISWSGNKVAPGMDAGGDKS